ncbi:MAG: DPP IV N-terminal domain-containing protein, partial [Bacteroides sp.]|nr:DPP IV N-terminal domain-containing protein [Bacteroides sp.]
MKNSMFTTLILVFATLSMFAQDQRLKLEDIYNNNLYPTRGYQSLRWMEDNKHYTTLEANPAAGCSEIVRYNVKSGERVVLVGADALRPDGLDKPLQLRDYRWSGDQNSILLFTNTQRVWRYHTRGDYWVLNRESGQLKQLGKGLKPASLMFAKFSPDGTRLAYVSQNNIYVEDLEGDLITPITKDGNERFVNGTFDWVYEEEFSCRDGFRWSNDSKHIVYWQSDTEGTGVFYMINNVDSIYSRVLPFPYPKVGTTNSAVKIGVVPASGGSTRWFDIPGDPRNNYLVRMELIPDSDQVMIQQLNRLQNTNRVWVAELGTMELENILTETDEAFLDLHDTPIWLDQNQNFTWISERDGWRHLYKVARDGSEILALTRGEFDVVEVVKIEPTSGYVYYIASPENFTQRYLYRSRLDGKGEAERMSPEEEPGQHRYAMSNNARWALHTYQSAISPPVISLVEVKNHKLVRVMEDNQE